MKIKRILLLLSMLTVLVITLSTSTYASLQSRPGATSYGTTPTLLFPKIRQMETSTGPMGLNATIDSTGTETSESNDIDVHMIKNTEYGAIEILCTSVYGVAWYDTTGSSSITSTGNNWGVFQMHEGSSEYIAGMWNIDNGYNTNIYNAEQKYWDKYEEQKPIPGDATEFTARYYSCSYVSESAPIFVRGYLPSYYYSGSSGKSNNSYPTSRAAIVNGKGL